MLAVVTNKLYLNGVGKDNITGWTPPPSMNNASFFRVIQYQYNTRAPLLQYNTIPIPMQY